MPGLDPSSHSINSNHKRVAEINDIAAMSPGYGDNEKRQKSSVLLGWSPPDSEEGAEPSTHFVPSAAHSAQPSTAPWPSQHQGQSQELEGNLRTLRGRSPNPNAGKRHNSGSSTEKPRGPAVRQGLPRFVDKGPSAACGVQPKESPYFEKAHNSFRPVRRWSLPSLDGKAGPSTSTRRPRDLATYSISQRASLVVEEECMKPSVTRSAQSTTSPHSSQTTAAGHQYFEAKYSSTTIRGWAPPKSEGIAGPSKSDGTYVEKSRAQDAPTPGSQGYPGLVEEEYKEPSPSDTPHSRPRTGPQYFKQARNTTIGDYANFSSVQGNQYINITERLEKKKIKLAINGDEDEEAEYAQFSDVPRCDVMALKTIYRNEEWVYDEEKGENIKCETLVTSSEVTIEGKESRCTVMAFQGGKVAANLWKKSFKRVSGMRRPEVTPLRAINRTDIPMLIFPTELLPLSHFVDKLPKLVQMFVETWITQTSCSYTEVWMDGSRGLLCRGPDGPDCNIKYMGFKVKDVPSNTSLLKEDTFIAYLAQLESKKEIDQEVVRGIGLTCTANGQRSDLVVDRPTVLFKAASASSYDTLAIGYNGWISLGIGLLSGKPLGDGVKRFTLNHEFRGPELKVGLASDWQTDWWLAQSHWVFHERSVSPKDNLSTYKLVLPKQLTGKLSSSDGQYKYRAGLPTIYLFTSIQSSRTFWSFDEDGQAVIPPRTCEFLGLPVDFMVTCWEYTNPTQAYEHMREYQKGRGFDPTTAEFARHCGWPIYEIVDSSVNRFEEVDTTGEF
ncbi:hypothetical protein PQX77_011354 [Marasmius sp. AFHP31]|nr:hypothetical protein PQX77_011354 [Marasmius sp. AFHP31]